jgi:hypothetical protein
LALHHPTPITFSIREVRLFDRSLDDPGVKFTKIRTGETQTGSRVHITYLQTDDGGLPTEANRERWITLFPKQAYILDATIKHMAGERGWGFTLLNKSEASEQAATLKK